MATPNYSYEKRQRELAKKRKAEEKRQKKQHQRGTDGGPAPDDGADNTAADSDTAPDATPPQPQA
ncbi:MAG: hypothetical protein HUU30_12915 [Burkholderiaceae bacterium]|nr:hypothetical protein [Aquabacterium sp.]NUP86636.1 hypothetical protein [Burkholderiaceae bacterium]